MGHLDGKNIVVTGAGRGIGRAVALSAAAEGANVVVADYGVAMDGSEPNSEVADAVVAEIEAAGGTALAVAGDISEMSVGEKVVSTCVDAWGSIDGAVCVAGIIRARMLFNMSEEEFDDVLRVHLKGHFTVYRHASAVMRKQETGGSIVGFTSGAFSASIAQANYAAAKAGIVSLTRSAALALGSRGVRANCVAPVARTRMSADVPQELTDIGDADEIAPAVIWLLSDASKDVNGQIYTMTGGRMAVWNQAAEVAEISKDEGAFTVEEIIERAGEIAPIPHPFEAEIAARKAAAEAKKAAEAGGA